VFGWLHEFYNVVIRVATGNFAREDHRGQPFWQLFIVLPLNLCQSNFFAFAHVTSGYKTLTLASLVVCGLLEFLVLEATKLTGATLLGRADRRFHQVC
jgi:hypothetical protein